MTSEYYLSIFGQTSKPSEEQLKMLLVYKDPTGINVMNNKNDYKIISKNKRFNPKKSMLIKLNEKTEFSPIIDEKYNSLTTKDHLWVKVSFNLKSDHKFKTEEIPLLVNTMEREEGNYGYSAVEIKSDSSNNEFFETYYLTPDIRDFEDKLKCYIWNRGKSIFEINNMKVEVFETKK